MAKLTKEEKAAKAARKKEAKKNAREALMKKRRNREVTWHSILRWVKMFFCFTQFLSVVEIIYSAMEGIEITTLRWVDCGLYLVMVLLLSHSIVKHKNHSGVVTFMLYGVVELGMYFLAGYVAKTQGTWTQEISDNLVYYTIGSCVLYIPTLIYYIKRWNTNLFEK